MLSRRCADDKEQATVACLRIDLYTMMTQLERAVAVGLEYLRRVGIEWPSHPGKEDALREYERIRSLLGSRSIEELIGSSAGERCGSGCDDSCPRENGSDCLNSRSKPPLLVDVPRRQSHSGTRELRRFTATPMPSLPPILGHILATTGPALGWRSSPTNSSNDRDSGVSRPGRIMSADSSWRGAVTSGLLVLCSAERSRPPIGMAILLMPPSIATTSTRTCSRPATRFQRCNVEAENGLAFVRKIRFDFAVDVIATQLALIRTLRGLTPVFGVLDDAEFDERRIERRFAENRDWAFAECWYWVRKLQARFFAGDYAIALDSASRAERLLWTSLSQFETAEYHFYAGLSHAASFDLAAPGERQKHVEALAAHCRQIEVWAQHCPENFANRAALVRAEIARIEDRALDAMDALRTGHPLGTGKRLCPERGARLRTGGALLRCTWV